MRIAITGSTGLVGERLVATLKDGGHDVLRLVRQPSKSAEDVYWNPATGVIDTQKLEGVDAVVHLAGVSISSGLWTRKRKQAIRESRVQGTSLLSNALASLKRPPKVLVAASGVNFYGDTGSEQRTEAAGPGSGFLADVVREWEAATAPAERAGIRVVNLRFGVIMAWEGGMLPLISLPFRFGVGGKIGDGRQWMSWIAIHDLIEIIKESIINEELVGPVNATSPKPVTNEMFTEVLGTVLRRPTFMRVPAFAARAVGGQLADELILISLRIVPDRLEELGFQFRYPTLESALRHEFHREEGEEPPIDIRAVARRRSVA
jgi:uncharacterized protein